MVPPRVNEGIGLHDEGVGFAFELREDRIEICLTGYLSDFEPHAFAVCRGRHLSDDALGSRGTWIYQEANYAALWHKLQYKFEALRVQFIVRKLTPVRLPPG